MTNISNLKGYSPKLHKKQKVNQKTFERTLAFQINQIRKNQKCYTKVPKHGIYIDLIRHLLFQKKTEMLRNLPIIQNSFYNKLFEGPKWF